MVNYDVDVRFFEGLCVLYTLGFFEGLCVLYTQCLRLGFEVERLRRVGLRVGFEVERLRLGLLEFVEGCCVGRCVDDIKFLPIDNDVTRANTKPVAPL